MSRARSDKSDDDPFTRPPPAPRESVTERPVIRKHVNRTELDDPGMGCRTCLTDVHFIAHY